MHTCIFSATPIGISAHLVHVEVDLSVGMIQFFIVGLPDTAIKESKQRISTALKNSGIRLPERKITVNLAPADLKKEGTLFDLPIAIGILQASNYIQLSKTFLDETLFFGELSLDGSIRPIKGALAIAHDATQLGKKRIILPEENAQEAARIKGIEIIGVRNLVQLISHLRAEVTVQPTIADEYIQAKATSIDFDFAQVKGQTQVKRALLLAAAGNHNILFMGPPGSGKTMLAKRLPSIMPAMDFDEMIQTSKIYSISGKLTEQTLIAKRPFRNPHHTISQAGLVGGGSFPQPGEISLAHNGILFLDELTEFKRDTLEALRQPLESKTVCLSRAQHTISYPASFLLIAALNPCPCGFLGDTKKECSCSSQARTKYMKKLSGPLMDRIDLQIFVTTIDYDTIKSKTCDGMTSEKMAQLVNKALAKQYARFNNTTRRNSDIRAEEIEKFCSMTPEAELLLKKLFNALQLSMRGYHKLIKVARTIADIQESDIIEVEHIKEAAFYRSVDTCNGSNG